MGDVTLFYHLLPFVEQESAYAAGNGLQLFSWAGSTRVWTMQLKTFIAPADPSPRRYLNINYGWLEGNATTQWAGSSYAYNYRVFGMANGNPWDAADWGTTYNVATIPDGSSNTIFLTEKLIGGPCYGSSGEGEFGSALFHGGWNLQRAPTIGAINNSPPMRATPTSCDWSRPHAFSAGGCMVGMGDGSVRNVRTSISAATWQAALLPADGVVLGNDW